MDREVRDAFGSFRMGILESFQFQRHHFRHAIGTVPTDGGMGRTFLYLNVFVCFLFVCKFFTVILSPLIDIHAYISYFSK